MMGLIGDARGDETGEEELVVELGELRREMRTKPCGDGRGKGPSRAGSEMLAARGEGVDQSEIFGGERAQRRIVGARVAHGDRRREGERRVAHDQCSAGEVTESLVAR